MVLPTCGSYVSQLCVLGTLDCRFLASVSQSVKWEGPQALSIFQMWQGSVDNFGIERLLLIEWLSALGLLSPLPAKQGMACISGSAWCIKGLGPVANLSS